MHSSSTTRYLIGENLVGKNFRHQAKFSSIFLDEKLYLFLEVCKYNSNIELVIVSHNLTNKFQPLDISANQSAKKFISNKFNWWHADRVRSQLPNGMAPGDLVM